MSRESTAQIAAMLALLLCAVMLQSDFATAQLAQASAAAFAPKPIEAIYTIGGIAVDERADTSAQARDSAVSFARRAAFKRLLRRLVPSEHQSRVPLLSDDQIADLIDGIEVDQEKTGGKRYIARLTIQFAPDAVRALMRGAGIQFSETAATPVFILPVYETGGVRILWETPNLWRDALAAAIVEEGAVADRLLPLYIPQGDFQDFSAISADQAAAAAPDRIAALLARYGGRDLLIAQVRIAPEGMDISLRRQSIEAEPSQMPAIENFEGQEGETAEQLMSRAARVIVQEMQERWKRDTALDFSQSAAMLVTAELASLSDWLALRVLLKNEPMIRELDVRALSAHEAQMVLHYLGTPEKLQSALLQRHLALTQASGNWVLRKI